MASPCVRNAGRTLSITDCAGWVTAAAKLTLPYRLAFEVRAREANAKASLSLMAPPSADRRPQPTAVVPLHADREWQEYVVDVDRTVTVHVGTDHIPFRSYTDPPVGSLAFRVQGAVEIRNPRIMTLADSTATTGIYRAGNGVTLPRVIHDVRPNYTAAAMNARIQGGVALECVVLPDGSVGRVTVLRSLDTQFGLDEEAIKAARQWKFEPGMRDGKPVPVVISIELAFTLK